MKKRSIKIQVLAHAGREGVEGRRGAEMAPCDFEALRAELQEKFPDMKITDELVMSKALYPDVSYTNISQFKC